MTFARQYYVKERLSLNLARLKKGGERFEIILKNPDTALELRAGRNVDIKDILQSEEIFEDAKKAKLAPEASLVKIFNTKDPIEIATQIIKKGEINLTEEHRKRILEQKRKTIIEYIHQNSIYPKTKLPQPVKRI